MPSSPPEGDDAARGRAKVTIASLFCRFATSKLNEELERFRVTFEAKFGETDITRRYTSTLLREEQDWLLEHYPKRYWAGLPPFVQGFIKEKMRIAHRSGTLDNMPGGILELYLKGSLEIGGDGFII